MKATHKLGASIKRLAVDFLFLPPLLLWFDGKSEALTLRRPAAKTQETFATVQS